MTRSADNRIFANGVDFLTGSYLSPPVEPAELAAIAAGEFEQTPQSEKTFAGAINAAISQPHLGFDETELGDPAEARWGVIFAGGEDDAVKQAVEPLIRHRAARLGFQPPVFEYKPGWNAADFLAAQGVARGYGEVNKVPYYLLIIGGPQRVPFRFQYELDPEYALGRLDFDAAQDYSDYIERLIDYETAQAVPNARDALVWATANQDDPNTALTSRLLARPLFDGINPARGFQTQFLGAGDGAGPAASKANLVALLSRPRPPVLLFTASHGLGFGKSDARQPAMQGALVTQDWRPGAGIGPEQIFTGADVSDAMHVRGLVHFAFACYGAGTPSQDDFAHGTGAASVIAERPFTAELPRRLLRQGALAFIGHVERVWGYSFLTPGAAPQPLGFARALDRLLKGVPVAHALRDLRDRAVQLTASLFEDLNDMDFGKVIPASSIAGKWLERNDARAYIVVGDPAACVRVKDMS